VGCQSAEEPLVYVIPPDDQIDVLEKQWAPFVDYLSEELERPVELVIGADYAAVVEAMKYGHADIAVTGASGYAMASQEVDIEVLAAEVMVSTGEPSYRAYIITRSDSGITELSDLNGASFAFTDVGSTSGYLMPNYILAKNGIEIGEEYFGGAQFVVVEAVLNGTTDAGSIAEQYYRQGINEGIFEEGDLVILNVSEPIPGTATWVRKDMDPALKQQITDALVAVPQEVMDATGRGNDINGYAPMKDSDYDVIRDLRETLGLDE
jgi:phosphonate transport system substrate-binding protein